MISTIYNNIKPILLRGRDVTHEHMIEDGLGMHATTPNNLVHYEQKFSRIPQIQKDFKSEDTGSFRSSQFYPHEYDVQQHQRNLRRCVSSSTNKESPASSMAAVRPDIDRRCYSSSRDPSQKQLSTSTAAFYDSSDMRGYSIDQNYHNNTYSEITPKTTRSVYSRQLSQSYSDFPHQSQRRRSLHGLNDLPEHSSANSAITGSQYSHPSRKPTSVVGVPTVSIQPRTYVQDVQYSSEIGTPDFELNKSFTPLKSSTPRERASTTTFGTEPQRQSTTFTTDHQAYPNGGSDAEFARRPSTTDDQAFDSSGGNLHSPMSNSGNSSAATTTTSDTVMPTIFNSSHPNKVAVAPMQTQKRSSYQRNSTKEEVPRFRSPYQVTVTPNIPSSRSFNRMNRMSNEVFIDGPPPNISSPDDQTSIRISMLENKLYELKHSLDNQIPQQAHHLIMEEIVNLKAQNQFLVQKYEEERKASARAKKKLDHLERELNEKSSQLFAANKHINLLNSEITALKQEAARADLERKSHEDIKSSQHSASSSNLNSSKSVIKPALQTPRLRGVEILTEPETEDET